MFKIHASDIVTFLKCRRAWDWSSNMRQGLESAKPYIPFYVGRAIHYCLEENVINGTAYEKSLEAFVENERSQMYDTDFIELVPNLELVQGMLEHYDLHWNREDISFCNKDFEFLNTEVEFDVSLEIPGRPDIALAGRFDGIVQHLPSGTFWIWETKTTRSITELLAGLDQNIQNYIYLWAADRLNTYPVKGIIYNIMKKAVPARPRVLNSGTLSKAKNLGTTYATYLDEIRVVHPDFRQTHIDEYYGEHLYWLKNESNSFYERRLLTRRTEDVERVMNYVRMIALDMVNEELPIYPNYNWIACNFCTFRNPCSLLDKGLNVSSVMQVDYRQKVVSHSLRTTEEINGDAQN